MARKIEVQIVGDERSLSRAFQKSSRDGQNWAKSLERVGRGGVVATVGFRGLGRSVAFASAQFLGGAGFVLGAKAALGAASDLNEEINKSKVLFGNNATAVIGWSRTTAKALGLSEKAALGAAGNFAAMFQSLKLGSRVTADMSQRLVKLGSDLASFFNVEPTEALEKLRSGLAGQARPLRVFGILLTENAVKQEAYRQHLAKSGAELTEQQKVLARYSLILRQAGKANNDFARTSRSQANQERINAALREQALARIGKVLLPTYNRATRAVNAWLGSEKNMQKVQNATQVTLNTVTGVVKTFVGIVKGISPAVAFANKALGGLQNTVKLLIAVFVAGKIVAFARSLDLLGNSAVASAAKVRATGFAYTAAGGQAAAANTKVNALRATLGRLGATALITIGIEILINRKSIDEKVSGFLRSHHLGFIAGAELKIPVTMDLASLEQQRDKVAALKGENDLMVKALDKAIAGFKALDKQRLSRVRATVRQLSHAVNEATGGRQIRVALAQRDLRHVMQQLSLVRDKDVNIKVLQTGVEALQGKLDGVKGKTVNVKFIEQGIAEIQRELANIRNKRVTVTIDMNTHGVGVGPRNTAPPPSAADAITNAIDLTVKAIHDGETKLKNAIKRGKGAAKRAFADVMSELDRAGVRASATPGLRDDLRVLNAKLAAVRQEMKVEGKTKDLLDQEAQLEADIATTERDIAKNAKDAAAAARDASKARAQSARDRAQRAREAAAASKKATQFVHLGLTREGDQRIPSTGALKRRLATLREQIKGTVLDTPKTQAELDRIGRVLSGKFGKLGRDVRAAILEMFGRISSALSSGDKTGTVHTKFRVQNTSEVLAGLDLTADQKRALRQRISRRGPGGTVPRTTATGGAFGAEAGPVSRTVNNGVIINGPVTVVASDPDEFNRKLQRKGQRTTRSRTGPAAGRPL